VRLCVDQQVLGLDVPMADLHAVNMRQRPTHLHTPQTDSHLQAMSERQKVRSPESADWQNGELVISLPGLHL